MTEGKGPERTQRTTGGRKGLKDRKTAGRNVFTLQFKNPKIFDPAILLLRIYLYISWGLT